LRNEATILLQTAQGDEGSVKSALGGGQGALDDGEQAEFDRGSEASGLHGGGFALAHAAEAPKVFSEFVDQDVFGGVDWGVLGAEGGAEAVELGGVFVGKNQLLGIEAVLEGVAAGTSLPFGRCRAGGEFRVRLIRGDLRRGTHTPVIINRGVAKFGGRLVVSG